MRFICYLSALIFCFFFLSSLPLSLSFDLCLFVDNGIYLRLWQKYRPRLQYAHTNWIWRCASNHSTNSDRPDHTHQQISSTQLDSEWKRQPFVECEMSIAAIWPTWLMLIKWTDWWHNNTKCYGCLALGVDDACGGERKLQEFTTVGLRTSQYERLSIWSEDVSGSVNNADEITFTNTSDRNERNKNIYQINLYAHS